MRSAFLLSMSALLLALATAVNGQVTLIDLGLPGAATNSLGQAINNNGTAIVRTNNETLSWLRAADGTYTPAGVPEGYTSSLLSGINDSGISVGSVRVGGVGSITRPAIRSVSGTYTLPLGLNEGYAIAINNSGDVVGEQSAPSPVRGFFYRPGSGVTYIPLPPGAQSGFPARPVSINNHGLVAGAVSVAGGPPGGGIVRGFKFTLAGGSVLMPTTGTEPAEVTDVNDSGVVVGSIGGAGATSVRAVKWLPDGTIVNLGAPSSTGFIIATAINSTGDIVGSGLIAGSRAVLWADDFGAVDLNDLLSPLDRFHWQLVLSYDINDQRQIVGLGRFDPDGPPGPAPAVNHGFLLNLPPIPEPAMSGLSLLFCFAIAARSRLSRRSERQVSQDSGIPIV